MPWILIGSTSSEGNKDSSHIRNAQSTYKGTTEVVTQATCISGPVATKILRSLCAHVTAVTTA
jgi:hypothetical protein